MTKEKEMTLREFDMSDIQRVCERVKAGLGEAARRRKLIGTDTSQVWSLE